MLLSREAYAANRSTLSALSTQGSETFARPSDDVDDATIVRAFADPHVPHLLGGRRLAAALERLGALRLPPPPAGALPAPPTSAVSVSSFAALPEVAALARWLLEHGEAPGRVQAFLLSMRGVWERIGRRPAAWTAEDVVKLLRDTRTPAQRAAMLDLVGGVRGIWLASSRQPFYQRQLDVFAAWLGLGLARVRAEGAPSGSAGPGSRRATRASRRPTKRARPAARGRPSR